MTNDSKTKRLRLAADRFERRVTTAKQASAAYGVVAAQIPQMQRTAFVFGLRNRDGWVLP